MPVIEVRAWGKRVGAIAPDPKLGFYAFAYEPSWRRTGIELAPLTMPLADGRETFVFSNLPEAGGDFSTAAWNVGGRPAG